MGHDYYCRVVHANYGFDRSTDGNVYSTIVAVVSCSITLWILVGGQNFIRGRGAGPLPPSPAGAGAADTETVRTDRQTDGQTDRQICYINIARQYADAR